MARLLLALAVASTLTTSGAFEEEPLEEIVSLLQTNLIVKQPANASASQLAKTIPALQPENVFARDFVTDGPLHPSTLPPSTQATPQRLVWRNAVAEFVAMTLFVIIGCGSAMAIAKDEGSAWVLQVSLAFGLAITTLAYSMGRYSGGQINCAVTFALWVKGSLLWEQALANFVAQMIGSVTGAIVLCVIFPKSLDKTGGLGSNAVSEGYHHFGALVAEFVMTFVLIITVLESGLQSAPASGIAVIPIGFAVFLAHCVLIPIDGCSINPTRSFGPALLATLRDQKAAYFADMWVFWVGPLFGALVAVGVHELFLRSL